MKIKKNDNGYFEFEGAIKYVWGTISCECCGAFLDNAYVRIINRLKDAGLLPRSFVMVCCECFNKKTCSCEMCGENKRFMFNTNDGHQICEECLDKYAY